VDSSRFVVQEHTTPDGVHWDLMLEQEGGLLTFRLPVPPAEAASAPTTATKIPDHPLRFLTYEGPVQNNTGRVRLADGGTVQIQHRTDSEIAFVLWGQVLRGVFTLTHIGDAEWTLTPEKPKSAGGDC
jgi:hypothetical protein